MSSSKATVLSLSLFATFANAQVFLGRETRRVTPEERHRQEVRMEAGNLAGKARNLLRKSQIAEAERLANQALDTCAPLGLDCAEGDDVLAEIAMIRKDPREVLRLLHHTPNIRDGILSYRGQTTRVLALIAIGDLVEARSALNRMAGPLDDPLDWRRASGVWDLPMDRDPSPRSLAATAYLLRADSLQQELKDPEVYDDLRAAERLAPGAVAIRLMLAKALFERGRFDEAEPYFTLVAAVNEPRARGEGERGLERVRLARERRKAGLIGGG